MASNSLDNSKSEPLTRSYSERNPDRNRDLGCRNYDGSTSLRRQNSENSRRCEASLKEKEYYRNQHHPPMSQIEPVSEDSLNLRSKFNEKELRSSCCNQQNQDENKEGYNNHYLMTISKYETIKEDYETLRRQYDDLAASHNSAVDKLEFKQEETNRLKQQIEDMMIEHNNVVLERNGLQQQCTQAVHKWNITLREREELQQAYKKLQQQYEEAVAARLKSNKDIKRLTEERNAAMQEYTLIMSERDMVHKEMEKLSEDLSQAVKKNKILENQNKELMEQKKTFSYHIETLKREIASALHDRDKALKECDDFRQKFGEFTAKEESHREAHKSRHDYSYIRERDAGRKDSGEMQASSIDLFDKCQKETMHNLDQANQEIERLRKLIDKQHTELQEALQEAEVSKRRRDWAFNERDKIVLQRETLKTMCEQLRKERDRDKIDLAEALRDSDEYKRQRNEASKELQVLKQKMETQLDKDNLMHLNTTDHNYSHDSAIDTDLQEWDTEMLKIDLSNLNSVENLGVELVGGRDDPYYPNDSGIYVSTICKGSIAERKLKVNDCIMRVNNLDCINVTKRAVIDAICSSGSNCNILVKRRRIGARSLFTTQLQLNNYDHGLSLETGMYISKIAPGSLAAKEGNLAVGDRVLSVNNKTMDGLKSAQDAMNILNKPADVLVITTLKSTHCSSNCGGGSNRDVYRKYTNSSTQTERFVCNNGFYENKENNGQFVPVVVNKADVEKANKAMGKWDTAMRSKDLTHARCTLKADKTLNHDSSSPITFDQERDDAIAELDSVIESYHSKHASRQQDEQVQMKIQKDNELEKNGGTWPKARMAPVLEHPTGTIVQNRKRERLPLSLFLNQTSNYNTPQSCCDSNTSKDSIDFSVKSGSIGKDLVDFYSKKKPAKYAISDVIDSGRTGSHVRIHSQVYSQPYSLAPFMPIRNHCGQTMLESQYPSSQSGESISLTDSRSYCFEPSYGTLTQFHHKHSPSVDTTYQKLKSLTSSGSHGHAGTIFRSDIVPESYHRYEGGTFPRKKENQRFRIPSNSSVTSKVSTSSIEKSSERGSPMPTIQVEVLDPRQNKRNSLPNYYWYKPSPGEERRVRIENSAEPLGITIQCLDNGAVFISGVTEHSLASQVGLQVGDQLLEVCGINMRNATYKWAERVLGQCKNNILLHVQYNPHKFNAVSGSDSSVTSGDDSRSDTHSGSPTPCNSPKMNRKSTPSSSMSHNPYTPTVTTLTRPKPCEKSGDFKDSSIAEARCLNLETHKCSNLGISLVGGNAVGIYVHSVAANSVAYKSGLRTGDHILEYNGTDLRQATAEEAAFELAKPADKVTVLVRNELERYNQIKDKPGDSFYVRALFDRTGDLGDRHQLQFRKDDILFVDNTMLNGVPGNWRATLIDHDGQAHQWGIIPSKYKVEEELLKRSLGDLEGDARRRTRRSFFRRKKQRNDSKELASFSNVNLDWFSDSGSLNDESTLASYQKVIRLNSEAMLRPVLIVGPLADCVTDKLLTDFPDKFNRCVPETRYSSQAVMEKYLAENVFIDYRKKGNAFECITVASVKESFNKRRHCILDINLASVKRLHNHHIYPIVLLIKFKSTKQIKEVKDTRYLSDKTTAKAAKEMYEHALKLESEYRHYISAVIPAGVNVTYMCAQIKAAVESEQNKTIWVPSTLT